MRDNSWVDREELTFTEEDRQKVFQQLKQKNHSAERKSLISISKRLTYVTASLFVVGLCFLLFLPSILSENILNDGTRTNPASVVGQSENTHTGLLSIKNESNRIPINLLFSYSEDKNEMKVISIPRDTYVPIITSDGTTMYDKLAHAYVYGSDGAGSVKNSVSELFDLPIDYYAVMHLETFSTMVHSVDGIEFDLEEDVRIRAITQDVFDLPKGPNQLSGEEVVALILDATNGSSIGSETIEILLNHLFNKLFTEIPQEQLEDAFAEIEGNIPKQLLDELPELPQTQLVSLTDGMIPVMKNELYYIEFDKDFLDSALDEFTTFE
ncbi:LCP family protein [Ornithinibacillus halotolerans]|uniref:Cell envelope-related transcriptional attenuator domain-containing protein n=1 Tax=Ornithinibacillus halotolerans TaxID=1274357 RepID=A0A916RL47_9BACI|nr:LCP family protein [Ornithinibacillus halotolerans]GGA60297.1 hypothetical protein GCM10008025_00390 [Ornithinibacillus halotolerans]